MSNIYDAACESYPFWFCKAVNALAELPSQGGVAGNVRRQRIWIESTIVCHLDGND
jgi:hypothetical protein